MNSLGIFVAKLVRRGLDPVDYKICGILDHWVQRIAISRTKPS